MKALVNGLGWLTPAGAGQGRQVQSQPLQPGKLQIPERKEVFAQMDRRYGRLDDFSRVGLAAVAFALRDAGADEWQEKRPLGIVAASRYGCLQTDLDYLQTMLPEQGKLASPNLFAYTLPNCFLGEAALRFGLTGNSMIVNRRDPDHLTAIKLGLEELLWSQQSGVLAGIVDLDPPAEFARRADHQGGLFLLLERGERKSIKSYGELVWRNDELTFNASKIENLSHLVELCLKTQAPVG